MRAKTVAMLLFGLILTVGGPARAEDDAKAKAVLDKAIEAHGGVAELKKLHSVLQKMKGTIHVMGMDIPFTGDFYESGERIRVEIEIDVNGMKFPVINVVNKDKGWTKVMDKTMELDKDKIAEGREQLYVAKVVTLAPLKNKGYTVSLVGDDKVGSTEVTVLRVTRKDHRDVSLFFDKKTNLLLKSESRVKDDMSGQEVNEERLYSDYNDKGLRQPKKLAIKRDGKAFIEAEVTEMKTDEKFDDSTFAKPE
jgi:hypothetical protein